MADSFDAIVVGARIAGCATAANLARRGWRVALVERKPGKLGPTLSVPICYPRGLKQFEVHGFRSVIESIMPQLAQARTFHIRLSPQIAIQGKSPAFAGYDYASILRREVLDDALLSHVLTEYAERVTYFPGHRVERLLTSNDGQQVNGIVAREGYSSHTLEAPLTIGADGRLSTIAKLIQAPEQNRRKPWTTIAYSYARGIDWSGWPDVMFSPGPDHRMVVMTHVCKVPGHELQVLGIFHPIGQYEAFAQRGHQELLATVKETPELAERITNLEWVGPAPNLNPALADGFFRPAGGPGWALVGDATHYKDPASGQGIHDALRTVGYLMEAIDLYSNGKGSPLTRNDAGTTNWLQTLAEMQRRRDQAFLPMYNYTYKFAEALTRDPKWYEAALFEAIADRPKLTQRFLGISSGATNVSDFNHDVPWYLLRHLPTFFVRQLMRR